MSVAGPTRANTGENMKRILYLANLNPNKFGSIEEYALFLSMELRQRGHRCYLGFISEPAPEIRRRFEEAGATVLTVYCGDTPLVGSRASINLREMMALRRMVVENRIDLVHINFMAVTNSSLLGVYFTRAKIVFTEHASGAAPRRSLVKNAVSRCIHGVLSRRIAKYVGVSEFVSRRLKVTHHAPAEKTITIYNGVNTRRFFPQDRNLARIKLNLPLDIPILCSVAMLIPEKGIQYLVEAISLLVKESKLVNIITLVVGEGYYCQSLKKMAEEKGVIKQIKFLGRRSDVATIIAASDMVVVPSVWDEAFGLIVVEAMASGRPVIASNVGGIPELIKDGAGGLLLACKDSTKITESIITLLQDKLLYEKLTDAGCKNVKEHFDILKSVTKMANVYNQVI